MRLAIGCWRAAALPTVWPVNPRLRVQIQGVRMEAGENCRLAFDWGCVRRVKFGDWGDGAEGFVVDQFFDEWRLWRGFVAGFCSGCIGAGFGGKERGDDLQVVEHLAGTIDIEVVGGDAAQQMRGDDEGGGAVLDELEEERFVLVDVAALVWRGRGAAGGVVVVAELLVAQSGRAALVSGGVNVTAAEALLGDFDEIG